MTANDESEVKLPMEIHRMDGWLTARREALVRSWMIALATVGTMLMGLWAWCGSLQGLEATLALCLGSERTAARTVIVALQIACIVQVCARARYRNPRSLGRLTERGIEARVFGGATNTIEWAQIARVDGKAPREHFGVTLLLTSGESVFLNIGHLAYPDSESSQATREALERTADQHYARAAMLHRRIVGEVMRRAGYRVTGASIVGEEPFLPDGARALLQSSRTNMR